MVDGFWERDESECILNEHGIKGVEPIHMVQSEWRPALILIPIHMGSNTV